MAATRANQNRKIRQEALREQLAEQCRMQHLFDNLKKIEQLDPNSPSFRNELDKYKEANAQRIKLMGYYLPALKQTEIKASIEAKEVKNFSDMYDD